VNALAYVSYHPPLALVQAGRAFKAVAISTIIGGTLGIALVALVLSLGSVAWSLAGAAAGEAASLVYIWTAAARMLRALPQQPVGAPKLRRANYGIPEWHL
jgi:O-antigen/teichoic acid export membrane protein